ncbi:MAG TPA: rhodanese-like domain-containing protein [Bryobacteraceae bacterium]|nr:rhodanese-like domain-containing protein [Bryobacteraceae bacterium]
MRSFDDSSAVKFTAANRDQWLAKLKKQNVVLVDLRPVEQFATGFIPGSLNLPSSACLAALAGNAFFEGREVVFLSEDERSVNETAAAFQRLGYPAIAGWFTPGILSLWRQHVSKLGQIEEIHADTLAVRIAAWKTLVLDVRANEDDHTARIPDSIHIPLEELPASIIGLPSETNITVICSTGNQCSFAASLLWRLGYRNLSILTGGIASYIRRGLRVVTSTP